MSINTVTACFGEENEGNRVDTTQYISGRWSYSQSALDDNKLGAPSDDMLRSTRKGGDDVGDIVDEDNDNDAVK